MSCTISVMNKKSPTKPKAPAARRPARIACGLVLAGMLAAWALVPGSGNGRACGQAPPNAASHLDPAEAALAERIADVARASLRTRQILPGHWRLAAALLTAAHDLDPGNVRYPHLLVDASLQLQNYPAALGAFKMIRSLDSDDRVVQANLIDLYAARMEGPNERLEYLKGLLAANVPTEVKSHVALKAAQCCFEKSQNRQALDFVEKALALNPLNLTALAIHYQQIESTLGAGDQVPILLQMLRSNPIQPAVVQRLASLLASVGAVDRSLTMFNLYMQLTQTGGMPVSRDVAFEYATELYLGNQPAAARQLLDAMLARDPNDHDAVIIRVLVEKAMGNQGHPEAFVQQLQNIVMNNLAQVRGQLGDARATTRPVNSQQPVDFGDFDSDRQRLADMAKEDFAKHDKLKDIYVGVLNDLAWTEIYLLKRPADATAAMAALREILPPESIMVANLEGWSKLASDAPAEARVKLSAVVDQKLPRLDVAQVLARLGMVRLDGADLKTQAQARDQGEKLLSEYPAGLIGAILNDGLASMGVKLVPQAQAEQLQAEVNKFPANWLHIIDTPQSFYRLTVEPLHVAHPFGEPIIVRVSVQNIQQAGGMDITIGNDGVLHPDLWFDGQLQGIASQPVPAIAYDRLDQQMVLHPGQVASKLVRIDQGQFADVLKSNPVPPFEFSVRVRTNPATNAASGCGPAGYSAESRMIERDAFNLNNIAALATAMGGSGSAVVRIQDLDLADALIRTLLANQQAQPADQQKQIQAMAQKLNQLIVAATHDASPAVASWAEWTLGVRSPPADRAQVVDHMLGDPYWAKRVLGLLVLSSGGLPGDKQRKSLEVVLAMEPDARVKAVAQAMQDLMVAMATQPATVPTTVPTASPAAMPASEPVAVPASEPVTQPALPLPVLPPTTGPAVTSPINEPESTPAASHLATAPAEVPSATVPAQKPDAAPSPVGLPGGDAAEWPVTTRHAVPDDAQK